MPNEAVQNFYHVRQMWAFDTKQTYKPIHRMSVIGGPKWDADIAGRMNEFWRA